MTDCNGEEGTSPTKPWASKGAEMSTLSIKGTQKLSSSLILIFALVMGATFTSSASTTDEEERFKVEMKLEDGWHGVNFDNTFKDWGVPSFIYAKPSQNAGSVNKRWSGFGWGGSARGVFGRSIYWIGHWSDSGYC